MKYLAHPLICKLLFALVSALTITSTVLLVTGNRLIIVSVLRMSLIVDRLFGFRAFSPCGENISLFFITACLAGCILGLFNILTPSATSLVLKLIASIVSLLAPFVFWYFVVREHCIYVYISAAGETVICLVGAIRWWRSGDSPRLIAVLMVGHYGFWMWMYSRDIANIVFVVIPIAASIAIASSFAYVSANRDVATLEDPSRPTSGQLPKHSSP